MGDKELDKVAAFDTIFTTNHIQIMKILLCYLNPQAQKSFAVCIKLSELQYTLSLFHSHPHASLHAASMDGPPDPMQLLDEILPYCTHSEKENLQHLQEMLRSFNNMQETMQMIQSLKELFPDGEGVFSEGGPFAGNFADILSGLGGMDLSQLMSIFQNNSS